MKKPDAVSEPAAKPLGLPWNPWLAVVFVVIVFYAAQLLGGIIVSVYPAVRHWTEAQATQWLDNSVLAQFFYILLAEAATLVHSICSCDIIGAALPLLACCAPAGAIWLTAWRRLRPTTCSTC